METYTLYSSTGELMRSYDGDIERLSAHMLHLANVEALNQNKALVDTGTIYYSLVSDEILFTFMFTDPPKIVLHGADQYEPKPIRNTNPAIWELIIEDMKNRDIMGREKHGGPLQPFNGRDALWDAYQEALDLIAYLRQAIYEKENPQACQQANPDQPK